MVSRLVTASLMVLLAVPVAGRAAEVRLSLTGGSFNPSLGETLGITYVLPRSEVVRLQVWDPDGGLVRTLVADEPREEGSHGVAWDGRDLDGRIVPDEAYTFTLETAGGEVFDPVTFSGGEVGDVTDAMVDRQAGTFNYRLPAASRVLVRLGIRNGPMLNTLVDWRPRVAGTITEYWGGRDESGLIDLASASGFTALVTYVTLPQATVITYGNGDDTYRAYKLGRAAGRPERPRRPRRAEGDERLRPVGLVPPAWARAPRIALSFPDREAEVPAASEKILVRVEVDPEDLPRLQEEQFEILFFVDNVFFAEAERGYLPFNWPWELTQLPPGEHVLTVNVSSFKGQVGVASRKVRVNRDGNAPGSR